MKTMSYKNAWVLVWKQNNTIWNYVANAEEKMSPKINDHDRTRLGSVLVPPFTPLDTREKMEKQPKKNRK